MGAPPGPRRTCIGCRRQAAMGDLVRIVRRGDGSLAIGRTLPGRGAWLCAGSLTCFDNAARRQAFIRAMRGPVAATAVDALRHDFVRSATAARD